MPESPLETSGQMVASHHLCMFRDKSLPPEAVYSNIDGFSCLKVLLLS